MARLQGAVGVAVVFVATVVVLAQAPSGTATEPSYQLFEFGVTPRPAFRQVLLSMQVVQDDLKLTAAQKKDIDAVNMQQMEKLQKARRDFSDRQKFFEARTKILEETQAARRQVLDPRQIERLDQIQLQAQGPLAFDRQMGMEGVDLAERLKLTDDQVKQARALAQEGSREIGNAAMVPIILDAKAGAPTVESIRKLVETPEFKTAKQKVRESARKTWAATIKRIEQVLTEPQRLAYHELLGAPFDLPKIRYSENEAAEDANEVASALNVAGGGGGGGGQRADPGFNTKVAHPAYQNEHPRILFDEGHNNFHTTDGRYKPFAELITSDGYKVIPSRDKFTKESLAKGDILISANPLVTFNEVECNSIRDWVRAGGSLLLITDHAPFGAAAAPLAKQFGVDMSKSFTSDPANSEGDATSLVFSRKNNLLGDHAITRGRNDSERINRIQTFTGQSLKGPAESVAILKLGNTAFDEGNDGKSVSAAGRAQGIALTFGDGRVVIMGEAAELSAQLIGNERFGMNVPGLDNRQMALNIMHWLSGLLEPRTASSKKAG